jgi:hypothetical protein
MPRLSVLVEPCQDSPMGLPRRIFVSRVSVHDGARAELAEALARRHGGRWQLDVFPTDGRWDADWRFECEHRIRACDAMIVLVGEGTADSAPVDWEVRTALAFARPVLALRIEDGDHPLPRALVEANVEPAEGTLEAAAAILDELLVDVALFRNRRQLHDHPQADRVFDQYKAIIDSAETLQNRRQALHAFYMSINSLFLAGIAVVGRESIQGDAWLAAGPIALAVTGLLMCESWRRQIAAYGAVNNSKFDVINKIERELPIAPFLAEWISLQQRNFESFTKTEGRIPSVFMLLYGVAVIAAVGVLLAEFV